MLNSLPDGITEVVYILKDPSSNEMDANSGIVRFPCQRVKEGSLICTL